MRFRLPMKSLLRDFAIMFCGSLLGLFLSRAFVTETSLDQCAALHMVKRKVTSSSSGGSHSKSSSIPWIIWRGMWNTTADDNSDMASDGGWEEPKEDMTPEGEDEELESEYVPGARAKPSRVSKRLGNSRFLSSRNGSSFRRKTLLVGVVTEEHHLQTLMTDVMATWGQSSRDLLFYSLRWLKKGTDNRAGKGTSHRTMYKKTRFRKASRDERNGLTVISLDAERKDVHPLVSEAISVLQHMYANLADSYDWFMFVPNNTYIRLDDIEQLLMEKDSASYILLGGPPASKHPDAEGSCDDKVGVVLSRALLNAVGGLIQLADSKGGSGDDTVLACTRDNYTYFGCITQKLGVECIHDYQASHTFKDAESVLPYILNSTQYLAHIPAPLPNSMYTLHQLFLKQDLDRSLAESTTIRSKIARNARELKRRTR